jgi:hypothetical protein
VTHRSANRPHSKLLIDGGNPIVAGDAGEISPGSEPPRLRSHIPHECIYRRRLGNDRQRKTLLPISRISRNS